MHVLSRSIDSPSSSTGTRSITMKRATAGCAPSWPTCFSIRKIRIAERANDNRELHSSVCLSGACSRTNLEAQVEDTIRGSGPVQLVEQGARRSNADLRGIDAHRRKT